MCAYYDHVPCERGLYRLLTPSGEVVVGLSIEVDARAGEIGSSGHDQRTRTVPETLLNLKE